MSKLCFGKGFPVQMGKSLVISNPAEWPERITHWDTWDNNYRQKGVKRIRLQCKTCGRRLLASVITCHDGCCIQFEMPPHKPKGWWKKHRKSKKKERRK